MILFDAGVVAAAYAGKEEVETRCEYLILYVQSIISTYHLTIFILPL